MKKDNETFHIDAKEAAYREAVREIKKLQKQGKSTVDSVVKSILSSCLNQYGIKANTFKISAHEVANLRASVNNRATTILIVKDEAAEAVDEKDKPRDKRKTLKMDLSGQEEPAEESSSRKFDPRATTRKLK